MNHNIDSIKVGVEGLYKNGLWTPVDIVCSGVYPGSWEIAVETVDSDGTPITYRRSQTQAVGAGKKFSRRIYVKLGRKDAPLTVTVRYTGDEIKSDGIVHKTATTRTLQPSGGTVRKSETSSDGFSEPVPFERPIFLIVGNDNIGLQEAIAELSLREDRRPILVKVKTFTDLPDEWFGYEAIDTVVLTTTEPRQFEGINSLSPQITALDQWVKLGGRLLFFPGKDAEPFLKPEDGALRPFLPGKFTGMTEIRQGTPFEVFINSERAIFMNGTEDSPFLRVPAFEPDGQHGRLLVKDGDLPLVLRRAHGLGSILYFGGDLSEKPLRNWRDRTRLVRKVMQWDARSGQAIQRGGALIQLGYNDMSGQIRSALDKFDGVWILPFSLILIVLVVYWLVIGPLDWLIVHKVLKRPFLTWATFPLWIVLFSVLCVAWLSAPGRPNKVILNELDIVDYDTETQSVRSSTWANLYSPRDATYSLALQGNLEWFLPFPPYSNYVPVPNIFSWHGLPGSGLGGMAPKTVSPTVWQSGSEQEFAGDTKELVHSIALQNVPVQVRSTKSFFGQSWATEMRHLPVFVRSTKMCLAQLKGMEGVPVGTLTWPDMLPPLDNCQLVYGRWVQDIGTLEPGKTLEVGKATERRELRELLLPAEAKADAAVRRVASYNPQSGDLDYIVRVLTFHEALGGTDGVGLNNAFQRSLDMSDLLSLDRCVLIGTVRHADTPMRADASATTLDLLDRKAKINRTVIFRQSIPIRDVAERVEYRFNPVLDQTESNLKSPDSYNPGF